jgi:hypothetical protein
MSNHKTEPVLVWADVDEGIADLVVYLNTIPGVRTLTSCSGSGEYGPYVMVTWVDEATLDRLKQEFDIEPFGANHGYLHTRAREQEKGNDESHH